VFCGGIGSYGKGAGDGRVWGKTGYLILGDT